MKKIITLLNLVIFSLILSGQSYAFPKNDLKPGGIAILPVTPVKKDRPDVFYTGKQVAVIKGNTNWLAIVGISLDDKVGTHQISIHNKRGQKKRHLRFKVHPHKYRTQYVTIRNKNKVNPNKKSMTRIVREMKLKKRLIKTFTPKQAHLNFIKPVPGRDSGRFGARRIFNKQKRNPHSGMDIAAPVGKTIKAAASGRVLYTGNLFFTGKVVYLDHGSGLISLYAHMSKIMVKAGQTVNKGQPIGKVGMTGRATGPHLHWSVYLNGNAVDPALFLN